MLSGQAARDRRRRISVEGRLDDIAAALNRDYDPALMRETGYSKTE